jgi:hypothetical protein
METTSRRTELEDAEPEDGGLSACFEEGEGLFQQM